MSVEAVGDRSQLEEMSSISELSSTWNSRDVRCNSLDDEATLIRVLALAHLGTQKEGFEAVRALEQEIYAIDEDDDDSDEDLLDPEEDALLEFIRTHPELVTPELLKTEERVKLLINDPTRPSDPLILHKGIGKKIVKAVRETGRKIKKGAKKHKKILVTTAVVVAGVVVVVLTAGAAAGAAAGALGSAVGAGATRENGKRKEEDDNATQPSKSTSSAGDPPSDTTSTPMPSNPLASQQTDIVAHGMPIVLTQAYPLSTTELSLPSDLFSLGAPRSSPPPVVPSQPLNLSLPPQQSNPFLPVWKAPLPPPLNEAPSTPPVKPFDHPPLPERPRTVISFEPDSPPVRVYTLEPLPPKIFEIPGKKLARGCIGGINGIANTVDEAKAHAQYLSQLGGNHHIEWVYNRTHSVLVDVLETVAVNSLGYSAPAKELNENWSKFHEKHENNPEAKYLQFCHSQGSLHVRNALIAAPQEIRDRIIVVAIAPAAVVSKEICFASFNYVSKRDPIHHTEAALYFGFEGRPADFFIDLSEKLRQELIVLEPHPDATGIDHGIESPTFKKVISERIKEYIEECGSPK